MLGPLRGEKFVVSPSMGMTYALGRDDNDQKFLSDNIEEGSVVFDVGANRGQVSLLFAAIVGGSGVVVSFEPVESLAYMIRRNVRLNNYDNVRVITAAASMDSGVAEFHYSPAHSTQGMLSDTEPTYMSPGTNTLEVRTVSLDQTAREMGLWPDVLKVDVEGGAKAVFEGFQQGLDRGTDIFIEQHGPEEQKAIKDEIIGRGYKAQTLDGVVIEDPTTGWYNPLWCTPPR